MNAVPEATRVEAEAEVCKHHWRIATPSGTRSEGVCSLCGEHRSFGNVFEDVIRSELRPPEQAA